MKNVEKITNIRIIIEKLFFNTIAWKWKLKWYIKEYKYSSLEMFSIYIDGISRDSTAGKQNRGYM